MNSKDKEILKSNWWGSLLVDSSPLELFRYRAIDDFFWLNTEKAIANREFRMTPVCDLNDKYEASPRIVADDITKFDEADALGRMFRFVSDSNTMLQRRVTGSILADQDSQRTILQERDISFRSELCDLIKHIPNNKIRDVLSVLSQKLRCACFSRVRDNRLMWSHYADSSKGVCLVFNDNYNYKSFTNNLIMPRDVVYTSERPVVTRFELWEAVAALIYMHRWEAGVFSVMSVDAPNVDAIMRLVFSKSKDWAYEQEVRIVDLSDAAGFKRWRGLQLVGLIMGKNISKKNRDRIACEYKNTLELFQVIDDEKSYSLQILPA